MSEDSNFVLVDEEKIPLKQLEGGAETERRRKLIPIIANEYLDPNNPAEIDHLVDKYDIPKSSLYYYFRKHGVSREAVKDLTPSVRKEVQKAAQEVISGEAEKIATIAFGLGATIAKRYLNVIDYMMWEGKSLAMIAEEVMDWFEAKTATNKRINQLEAEILRLEAELQAAYAMNLPNFKYWLRTRILERYATQVIQARLMGVRLPVGRAMKAMQQDLLRLEMDIDDLYEGDEIVAQP